MTDKPGEQRALGATDIDTARLEFDRERHRAELALKQREQELRFEFERKQHEQELAFKQAELEFRRSSDNGVWGNPMVLAVAAGVLGLISNAVVTLVDGIENRALEHQKSEATMILEALKTGDADEAAQNLNLLVETGLVTQHKAELTAYLESHKIDGAVLPSALGSAAQERSAAKATSQQISAETANWKAFCLKGIVSEDIQLCTFDTQQACDEYLKSATGPLMRNHTCVAKPAAVSCYLMTRPGRPDSVECYADLTRCAASAQRVLTSTAAGSPEEVCTEFKLAN